MTKDISKSKFKPRMLELLREVEHTGIPLVLTDHGKPVIEIRPYREAESRDPLEPLRGCVKRYDAPFEPVDEDAWEAPR